MPYQPTAGDVVRLGGINGPRATIVQLRRRVDRVPFFKAQREDTGELVWPDHAVADCTGVHQRICAECEIPFQTDDGFESLCPNCDKRHVEGPDSRRKTGARWWRT